MNLTIQLKKVIEEKLQGSNVQVLDPNKDGCHLQAIVVSQKFEGLSLLERHQQIMDAIKDFFSESLHAITLKTYTPNEVKKKNE